MSHARIRAQLNLKENHILDLPEDILKLILQFLPDEKGFKDLMRLSETNKAFNDLIHNHMKFIFHEFPEQFNQLLSSIELQLDQLKINNQQLKEELANIESQFRIKRSFHNRESLNWTNIFIMFFSHIPHVLVLFDIIINNKNPDNLFKITLAFLSLVEDIAEFFARHVVEANAYPAAIIVILLAVPLISILEFFLLKSLQKYPKVIKDHFAKNKQKKAAVEKHCLTNDPFEIEFVNKHAHFFNLLDANFNQRISLLNHEHKHLQNKHHLKIAPHDEDYSDEEMGLLTNRRK